MREALKDMRSSTSCAPWDKWKFSMNMKMHIKILGFVFEDIEDTLAMPAS